MKKRSTITSLILLCIAIMSSQGFAGLFDDRYPHPRVLAMGNSGVASTNDVWSSYYNPAGLSRVNNVQIGSSYLRLFNLSFFDNFFGAASYPIGKYGTASLSFQYFGVQYEGENLSGEYSLALSHGFYLLKDVHSSLAFGYSLKAYHWNLGNSVEGLQLGSSTSLGVDVGLQASVYSRTHIGVYFLNLNAPQVGEFTKHDLPQRVVAGISYQPYDGVTTSLDFNRLLGSSEMEVWAGAEFQVFDFIFLRFGGTTNPNRFSTGLGLDVKKLKIDYALVTHSELGETHSVGLMYGF